MLKKLFLCVAFAFVASTASAQFVLNPNFIEFTPSVDDAQVTRYEMGFYLIGAAEPMQLLDLGRPAVDGANKATVALPARPVPLNKYVAKARAYAGDVVGPWSEPSNEFGYDPRPPNRPAVR
jgi:hypothetical protein